MKEKFIHVSIEDAHTGIRSVDIMEYYNKVHLPRLRAYSELPYIDLITIGGDWFDNPRVDTKMPEIMILDYLKIAREKGALVRQIEGTRGHEGGGILDVLKQYTKYKKIYEFEEVDALADSIKNKINKEYAIQLFNGNAKDDIVKDLTEYYDTHIRLLEDSVYENAINVW